MLRIQVEHWMAAKQSLTAENAFQKTIEEFKHLTLKIQTPPKSRRRDTNDKSQKSFWRANERTLDGRNP